MITTSLVIMLLTLNRKIPVVMARTWWSPGILWACGVELEVEGTASVKPGSSYVFVSNHASYLDIPLLFRAIPKNLYFVAKKEIKWVPFVGWYMAATGMIFVDRTNRSKSVESLKKAALLIKKGKSVLMFPEGTRSRHGEINTFKKGPFMLASQADIAVVPISIKGSDAVLKPGGFSIVPQKVNVCIGEPMKCADVKEIASFIEEVRKKVTEMNQRVVA